MSVQRRQALLALLASLLLAACSAVRTPAGIPQGVAGVSTARLKLADATPRAVTGAFNDERIVGRTWPASEGRLVLLELHD
jgi:hypothetical protein